MVSGGKNTVRFRKSSKQTPVYTHMHNPVRLYALSKSCIPPHAAQVNKSATRNRRLSMYNPFGEFHRGFLWTNSHHQPASLPPPPKHNNNSNSTEKKIIRQTLCIDGEASASSTATLGCTFSSFPAVTKASSCRNVPAAGQPQLFSPSVGWLQHSPM